MTGGSPHEMHAIAAAEKARPLASFFMRITVCGAPRPVGGADRRDGLPHPVLDVDTRVEAQLLPRPRDRISVDVSKEYQAAARDRWCFAQAGEERLGDDGGRPAERIGDVEPRREGQRGRRRVEDEGPEDESEST